MQKIFSFAVLVVFLSLPAIGERKLDSKFSLLKIEYPEKALQARIQGIVVVSVEIERDGTVVKVLPKPSNQQPVLTEYVLENVKGWKFKEGRQETIDFTFFFFFAQEKKGERVKFYPELHGVFVGHLLPAKE